MANRDRNADDRSSNATGFPIMSPVTLNAPEQDQFGSQPGDQPVSVRVDGVPLQSTRFQALRAHAQGGLGIVSVAFDSELEREVAVKQIRSNRADNPTSRARFLFEAKVTAGLEHPGIVPVYALGEDAAGRPYYAMRLIHGKTLGETITEFHADAGLRSNAGERSIRLFRLLRRFIDVCNAVEYAHDHGVLHRDLKPDNIMIGEYGETIVVDWGLAKSLGDNLVSREISVSLFDSFPKSPGLTDAGSKVGTPDYMSPEQAKGDHARVSAASDVYSLGATLYSILTGRSPFPASDTDQKFRAIQVGHFIAPRQVSPSVPKPLEAICKRAMAIDPEERFHSSRALAEDIERWIADQPILAYQESPGEQAQRWVRRHKTLATSTALTALVALLGLAAVLTVQSRASARLKSSNQQLTESNTALSAANERERARFDLAMQTIKRFHTGISEDFLLKQNDFEDLRNKLLTNARDSYGSLRRLLEGQTDRTSRLALGKAVYEFGLLTELVGTREDALSAFEQSLDVIRSIRADAEGDLEIKEQEGLCQLAVGLLRTRTDKSDAALTSLHHAATIFEDLTGASPENSRFQEKLAKALFSIGFVLIRDGKREEGRAFSEKAKNMQQTLVNRNPAVSDLQKQLAIYFTRIGLNLKEEGKLAEARRYYEIARAVLEQLVRFNPKEPEFQSELADNLIRSGSLLGETGDQASALAHLERARSIRETLVRDRPNVVELQRQLANIYGTIGALLRETSRLPEAFEFLRKASGIHEDLTRRNARFSDLQRDLADDYNTIALLLREVGKAAEALKYYEKSRLIVDRLLRNNPDQFHLHGHLSDLLNNMGSVYTELGRPDDALAAYNGSRASLEAISSKNPEAPSFREKLAATLINTGEIQRTMGDLAGARSTFEGANAILAELVDRYPNVPQYRNDLAYDFIQMGWVLRASGKPAAAITYHDRAGMLLGALVKSNPEILLSQEYLAMNYQAKALLYSTTGRLQDAVSSAQIAHQLWDDLANRQPMSADFRQHMADCLGYLGLFRISAGQVEKGRADLRAACGILEAASDLKYTQRYNEACFYAILSRTTPPRKKGSLSDDAREDANRALLVLNRAVADGFRDMRLLRTDTDLDPLRARPDFKQLLMNLEFPANPFAR
jgi:eukaryotic-like serine/threonine-protein kinase